MAEEVRLGEICKSGRIWGLVVAFKEQKMLELKIEGIGETEDEFIHYQTLNKAGCKTQLNRHDFN